MDSSSNASASRSNNNKKKGHKKTTNEQFIMLVHEMDKFPDVMKGKPVFGANKIKLEGTWTRLVDKLNSIGPPHRTMSEWKKEFMMLVFNFAEKNEIEHKFNAAKRMAGLSWVKAFLQRHSEFSLRKPIATEIPRVMDINIPQVYSDLRGRINKRRVDTKSYLKESPRTSKRATSLTDAEYSGDPLVLQISSPKREPNFEDSQEATSSHTEEETPLFYPESPHFFAALGGTSCQPETQQQLPDSGVTKNSPSESQSFSLLQQQIQNQTMLLDILKNMTNNIGVLLERQTTATERQAAAAERQAAASEAIIRLLQGGDCSEIIEKLQNTSNK